MKEDILKRAMFAMPLSKDARNSGILSGFDMEEMDEMPEPSEEMPQMSRTPQNPEILMNTLRGDMRSVDARYQELAQMVGEEAAMETPPEVLAMLQPQLGAQQGGIGGLPGAQGMMPPGAPPQAGQQPPAPPPGPQGIAAAMPPGMASAPPFPQGGAEQAPPQQLAGGGEVTGEGGITLRVPISVGAGGMGGMGGGQLGQQATTALQQGYGASQGAPNQLEGFNQEYMQNVMRSQLGGGDMSAAMTPEQQDAAQKAAQTGAAFAAFKQSQAAQAGSGSQQVPGATAPASEGGPKIAPPVLNPIMSQGMSLQRQQDYVNLYGNAFKGNSMFADGGMVNHPPTPDGMPPLHAFGGAFVNPMMRFAQMGADKLSTLGMEANALGGRLMSQGFPQTFRPIFENVRGEGGRYTAEQILKYPTLTQHLSNLAGPQATTMAGRASTLAAPAATTAAGMLGASGVYKGMAGDQTDPVRQELMQKFEQEYYRTRDRSIPMQNLDRLSNDQLAQAIANMSGMSDQSQSGTPAPATPAPPKVAAPAVPSSEAAPSADPLGDFIQQKLAAQQERDAATKVTPNVAKPTLEPALSKSERVKAARNEYADLYRELLGDTKDEMQTNALLMLADAGFKYAGAPVTPGSTPMTRLAQSLGGIPQGFMALLSQAKERQLKVDTAALSQAVSDVQEQDKQVQQIKLEMLKGDYRLLAEQIKQGGGQLKDGGAGLIVAETKGGGYKGMSVDPNNPTVQSALASRYTLRPTDNPFVENRGEAPTTVETDKEERVKLTSTLRSLDNSLSTLDNLKGVYSQAYGPGAWFSDKVNNLLVPVLPTAVVRPDVNLVDASTRISSGMNSILKNMASANDGGRVAVQEQEWARDTAKGIADPTKFFADKELAAKQFNSMETMLRNARQQVITQLGYEKNDYAMRTPNTGTQTDPFQIPQDPDQAKRMYNFLGSTIGKLQDPRATVYIRMPNGSVQGFNPMQLRGLVQ